MTTTTDKLAEALRGLAERHGYKASHPSAEVRGLLADDVRAALAAYDAERASAAREPAGAHTPEPWAIGFSDGTGQGYITAGDHPALRKPEESVAVVVSGGTDDWGVTHGVRRPEDARRIVACVNACAGIPDPDRAVHVLRDLARTFDGIDEDEEVSGSDALDALAELAARAKRAIGGAP